MPTSNETKSVELLSAQIAVLHDDVGEVRSVLRELTSAITKLALVEERQAMATDALNRAFSAISKCEGRLSEIEKKMPSFDRTALWVDKAVWAAAAAALVYIAKAAGLI